MVAQIRSSKKCGALSVLLTALIIAPPGAAQAPSSDAATRPPSAESSPEEDIVQQSVDAGTGEIEEFEEFEPAPDVDSTDDLASEVDIDSDVEEITIRGSRTSALETAPISGTYFGGADLATLYVTSAAIDSKSKLSSCCRAGDPRRIGRSLGFLKSV